MATAYEIPLTPQAQAFNIALSGVIYSLRVAYADAPEAGWFLDLSGSDGTPLLAGAPLLPGRDLLEQYAYLGLGGQLIVVNDRNADAAPAYSELGVTAHLLWVTA